MQRTVHALGCQPKRCECTETSGFKLAGSFLDADDDLHSLGIGTEAPLAYLGCTGVNIVGQVAHMRARVLEMGCEIHERSRVIEALGNQAAAGTPAGLSTCSFGRDLPLCLVFEGLGVLTGGREARGRGEGRAVAKQCRSRKA